MLGEQEIGLVVHTEVQQRDEQQVSGTLVVAGVQLQQCTIVASASSSRPTFLSACASPSRAGMYGRVSR
jgi:hypothetical protein